MKTLKIFFIALTFVSFACGEDNPNAQFEELIDAGWSAFGQGDYQSAFNNFSDAKTLNPDTAAAYIGLGWSLMMRDFIDQASGELNVGSTKTNPEVDLFAAWAFVLNAQKSYASSNAQITQTLTMDADWTFTRRLQLGLNKNDLRVLKAENHFLLGEFTESLAEVKILNASFSLSTITTDADRAQLAKEIQRLKGVS